MVKKLYNKMVRLANSESFQNWQYGFLCGMGFWCILWEIAMVVGYFKGLTFAWIPR